jgi:hypothetical protein
MSAPVDVNNKVLVYDAVARSCDEPHGVLWVYALPSSVQRSTCNPLVGLSKLFMHCGAIP